MGKLLINEKNIIEKNIIQQLQLSYTAQSKRLDGTPIYITYFNKNLNVSQQDHILENVKELLGEESPLFYNKIENTPLFLVSEIANNMELDETFGLNTETQGEGVLLPNTIKPYVDDFLIINYIEEDLLFRVTKVEMDKLNGKKFYRINFELSHYKQEQVEDQVEDEYVTEYNNIGTHDNPIIEKYKYILIEEIRTCIRKLKKFYINSFLNTKYNVFVYKYNDKIIYNEFLIRFIINNSLLENKEREIVQSIYIQDIFPDSPAMYELYESTLYYALEENDSSLFKYENMITMQIQKDCKDNPFALDYNDYYRVYYTENNNKKNTEEIIELDKEYQSYKNNKKISLSYNDIFGGFHVASYGFEDKPDPPNLNRHVLIIPHENKFHINIENNIEFEDKRKHFLENIIIKYFNKELDINSDFINSINKFNFHPTFLEYLLMPCLFFILYNKIDELTNNK